MATTLREKVFERSRVASHGTEPPPRVKVIKPSRGWASLRWRELWDYRELLFFFLWRDVKVRGKQTALGMVWILLQPVLTTLVFTVIFGNLVKMPSENVPYALFALAGVVPWNYFAGALSRGSASMVSNAQLITKVYFPRLLIPTGSVLSGAIDLVVTLVLLIGLMIYFGIFPTAAILTLPFFLLLTTLAALGASLWLSAWYVRYRDVGYLIPFLIQFWFFATPVVYPASLIPDKWRLLYALNPMVGVVEGFRWALFNHSELDLPVLAVSLVATVVVLVTGAFLFRRMERTLADIA